MYKNHHFLTAAAFSLSLLIFASGCTLRPSSDRTDTSSSKAKESSEAVESAETSTPTETTEASSVRIEDLVTVADSLHLQSTDPDNLYDCLYTYPKINVSGAETCNKQIADACQKIMEEAKTANEDGYSQVCCGIHYQASLCDDLLSVVVTIENDWDCEQYLVYVFDLQSGMQLDNSGLCAIWNYDGQQTTDLIYNTVHDYFEQQNYEARTNSNIGESTYDDLLNRTVSEENLASASLYIGTDGHLYLCCNIYSFAGAESYWNLIPVTTLSPTYARFTSLCSPTSIS
jgi:hypothetical protein